MFSGMETFVENLPSKKDVACKSVVAMPLSVDGMDVDGGYHPPSIRLALFGPSGDGGDRLLTSVKRFVRSAVVTYP